MTACFTRFRACKAICDNIREALPEQCYEQLEDKLMGYKEVSIMDYFNHLDDRWCKMDTKMRKTMRKEFYEPWDQIMHVSKFGLKLNKEQKYLKTCGITIDEDAKVQFYTEQMINSGMFEKKDVIEWEDVKVKTWTHATFFF